MTETKRYTDEQIRERFEMAEKFCDDIEAKLLSECPEEIIDKFRIGANELFRILLIAPGMELEEGLWSCQSAPDTDAQLGMAPAELVLEAGPSLSCKYRVRVRTEAPTIEQLVEEPMHAINDPESWEEISSWVIAMLAMDVIETDK